MLNEKGLRIFGLACKAGKARVGTMITEQLIRGHQAKLVLIAADGSEKQKEKLIRLCHQYRTVYIEVSSKEALGEMSGRDQVLCAAVTDENFKAGMINNTN